MFFAKVYNRNIFLVVELTTGQLSPVDAAGNYGILLAPPRITAVLQSIYRKKGSWVVGLTYWLSVFCDNKPPIFQGGLSV